MASTFTVEAIPEKGYGLIATNDLRRGAIIMHVNRSISTINHSCVPNAHVVATSTGEDGHSELVAIRHITAGEEISVSYNESLRGTPTAQRKKYLRAAFGVDCKCSCCTQDAEALLISDARRNIINALWSLKQCIHPVDNSALDRLEMNNNAHLPINPFEQPPRDPSTIPLVEVMGPFCYLLAQFLQAEGLLGIDVGAAYYDAALHLRTQMQDRNDGTIVFKHALHAARWIEAAAKVYNILLPEHNVERYEFNQSFKGFTRTFELSCGIGAYDQLTDGMAAARRNGDSKIIEVNKFKNYGIVFGFLEGDKPYWTPCSAAEHNDLLRRQAANPQVLSRSRDAVEAWRDGLAAVRRGEFEGDSIADLIRANDLRGELGLNGRSRGVGGW